MKNSSEDYLCFRYFSAVKSTAPSSVDDVIVVNGTHMSEEVSARILQSLSQKSAYHTNSNVNSNVSGNGIAVYRNIQTVPGPHKPSQSPVNVRNIYFFASAYHFDLSLFLAFGVNILSDGTILLFTQLLLLQSGLQSHRSIHSLPMKPLQSSRSYTDTISKGGPEYFRVK